MKFIIILITIISLLAHPTYPSLANEATLRVPIDNQTTNKRIWKALTKQRTDRFESYGKAENPSIILIPGIDGITDVYYSQMFRLAEKFHVIAYHLPLAEETEDGKYSSDFIVQDLYDVMEELGIEKTHIIGTSFGSFGVAQHFVTKHPEKVDKLVLISSAAHLQLSWKHKLMAKALPFVPLNIILHFFAKDVISKEDENYEWKRKKYRQKGVEVTSRKTAIERIKLSKGIDFRETLKDITHDVLIVHGEHDNFMGKRDALGLIKALPKANVKDIAVPGGHIPQWTTDGDAPLNRELCSFL